VAGVRSFEDLVAFQKARALAKAVFHHTKRFPRDDRYELTSQLRRAANSVALNIAEGFGIGTSQGTLRHLRIARGSLREVRAALLLAADFEFAPAPPDLEQVLEETSRVLQALIQSMESR
jgi:four helix bundle protein